MINKKIKLDTKLLKKNKVGLVILFGSKADKISHPLSDVDLGVIFLDENIRKEKPLEVYGFLYEVFSKHFKESKIDIVYLRETPLSLQFKAIRQGKVLYAASSKFLADYREETMIRYFDFQFVENYFNKVFLGEKI